MAKQWSATTFAASVLLCSLVVVSAGFKKGGGPWPMDTGYVSPPVFPYPQKPGPPVPPQSPQTPQYPPQYPPQSPQTPQYPPQYPPQSPQTPQYPPKYPPVVPPPVVPPPIMPPPKYPPKYPQPPVPPQPQYPQPQVPSPPQYPSPQNPQDPQIFYDFSKTSKQPPKVPQTPQIPSNPTPQIPSNPPVKNCDVERHVRVPCGVPGISAAGCESIDCCFDGQSCFFGKGVTLQCTKDAHFIVVVAREVTVPHIDLETISLLGAGQSCSYVDSNSAFAIYYFGVTDCGSVVTEEPGVIIYSNRMTSSYEVGVGPHGAITRDSSYEFQFQCRYIGTSVETLVVEVLPLDNPPLPIAEVGPLRVHLKIGNGHCHTKGCHEVDVAYNSFYMDSDYPVTKVLRDPVYVEVELLEKTDPALVLTLGRCWATTNPEPHSLPQWDILIGGCPYRDDRYLSELVPVGQNSGLPFPSHHRRFLFKMFTFVDPHTMEPLKEHVYIHCSTDVCVPGLGASCEPQCYRRRRDVAAKKESASEPKVVVSSGELIMTAASE